MKTRVVLSAIAAVIITAVIGRAGVYDYSTTPASNTTINGTTAPVGAMPPSNVGPILRGMAAADAQWADDTGCALTTAGSSTVYTFDAASNPYSGAATFADGDHFSAIIDETNTGASTLNVETEGAKAIRKLNDQALVAGDLVLGSCVHFYYDASANGAAGAWLIPSVTVDASAVKPTTARCYRFSDEVTAITATAGKLTFRMPYAFTVTGIRGSLSTTQASGNIFTVDVNESGTTILSTKITIDNTEETSTTALAAPVISDSSLADDAEMTIDVDQIGDGTAKGGRVCLIGTRT